MAGTCGFRFELIIQRLYLFSKMYIIIFCVILH